MRSSKIDDPFVNNRSQKREANMARIRIKFITPWKQGLKHDIGIDIYLLFHPIQHSYTFIIS